MKQHLRIALPPLASLTPQSSIAFALFGRDGRVIRSGEQPLEQLATFVPAQHVLAILHPDDAVVVTVALPPLSAARMDAAVHSRIEPMALSELQDLCIAHGPRTPDGQVQAAWVSRRPLLEAWQRLHEARLEIKALIPFELALPPGDANPEHPLTLPADARWQAPLPNWSLARSEWRPARHSQHWRNSLVWAAAAALLWAVGLHLHAAQLRNETQALQARTEDAVRAAFPSIPAILDPLRQTHGQLEQLRLTHGVTAQDDFMPLALDTARTLDFAAGHVTSLHYGDKRLTLTLAEGYQPPADETVLQRNAAAAGLELSKDAKAPHVWHAVRNDSTAGTGQERRP